MLKRFCTSLLYLIGPFQFFLFIRRSGPISYSNIANYFINASKTQLKKHICQWTLILMYDYTKLVEPGNSQEIMAHWFLHWTSSFATCALYDSECRLGGSISVQDADIEWCLNTTGFALLKKKPEWNWLNTSKADVPEQNCLNLRPNDECHAFVWVWF